MGSPQWLSQSRYITLLSWYSQRGKTSNYMFRRAMATSTKLNPRNFPRPPLCEKTPRHLQVKWDGEVIADTKEGYWVLETHHPPTYYIPPSAQDSSYKDKQYFLLRVEGDGDVLCRREPQKA